LKLSRLYGMIGQVMINGVRRLRDIAVHGDARWVIGSRIGFAPRTTPGLKYGVPSAWWAREITHYLKLGPRQIGVRTSVLEYF
jgi:hypothetical protein